MFTKFYISPLKFLLLATFIQTSMQLYPSVRNAKYCYESVGLSTKKYLVTDGDSRMTQPPEQLVVTTSVEIQYTEKDEKMTETAYSSDLYKLLNTNNCRGSLYVSRNRKPNSKMHVHISFSLGEDLMLLDEAVVTFEPAARLGNVQVSTMRGIFIFFLNLRNDQGVLKNLEVFRINQLIPLFNWNSSPGNCIMASTLDEIVTLRPVPQPATNSLPLKIVAIKLCVYTTTEVKLCKVFPAWRVTCPAATSLKQVKFLLGRHTDSRQVAMIPVPVGTNPYSDPTGDYFTKTGTNYFTVENAVNEPVTQLPTTMTLPGIGLFDYEVRFEDNGLRTIRMFEKTGTELSKSVIEAYQYILDDQGKYDKWEFIS